jgi:hypothetical protein
MTNLEGKFPAFTDERGTLVPVELPEVDIDVQRVFVVSAPEGGARRGNHEVTCHEVIVLVSGGATVETAAGPAGPFERSELTVAGQYVVAGPDHWLRYSLHDERSAILVLADAPYDHCAGHRPAPR